MLKSRPLGLVAGLVVWFLSGQVSWSDNSPARPSIQNYFQHVNYGSYTSLVEQNNYQSLASQPDTGLKVSQDIYQAQIKSTKKAFFYSLLVPGAGELYGGSKLKAIGFLGLEALFWAGYFHYHSQGNDKTKEYQTYADKNWNPDLYRDSLANVYFQKERFSYDGYTIHIDSTTLQPTNLDTLMAFVRSNEDVVYDIEDSLSLLKRDPSQFGFTHHSVKIDRLQYYENIGKYDQFSWGWDNGIHEGDPFNNIAPVVMTAVRFGYLSMRRDANSLYDKAKWAQVATLANHVLSAIDAALTVKSYNRKQDRFSEASLKIRMVPEDQGISPRAVLTVKF